MAANGLWGGKHFLRLLVKKFVELQPLKHYINLLMVYIYLTFCEFSL